MLEAQGTIAMADIRNGGNPDHFKYGTNRKDCVGCVRGESRMNSRSWTNNQDKRDCWRDSGRKMRSHFGIVVSEK